MACRGGRGVKALVWAREQLDFQGRVSKSCEDRGRETRGS